MDYLLLAGSFWLPLIVTILLVPAVSAVAIRKGWVDAPDAKRKLHARPTPSIGGIAIAAGMGAGLVYLGAVDASMPFGIAFPSFQLWLGAAMMFLAGVYDDIYGLGFKRKFVVQICAAYVLMHAGYRLDLASLPFVELDAYHEALYAIPLTLVWIVGIINAVNLIDGLDGLASGVVMIAFASLALAFGLHGQVGVAVLAFPVAGALAGFLVFNSNPASIFMGDSGSLLLGFLLAAFSLQGHAHAEPLIALAVPAVALGLPILDTAMSIVRRVLQKKAICAPDHDHIHHRLTRLFSHKRAVIVLYAIALWFGSTAVLMTVLETFGSLLVLGITILSAMLGLRLLGYMGAKAPAVKTRRSEQAAVSRVPLHVVDLPAEGVEIGTIEEERSPAMRGLYLVPGKQRVAADQG